LKFQNFVAKESGEIIGEAIFSHGAIERGDQHRADRCAMAASIPSELGYGSTVHIICAPADQAPGNNCGI
jgi:hypothetical protein